MPPTNNDVCTVQSAKHIRVPEALGVNTDKQHQLSCAREAKRKHEVIAVGIAFDMERLGHTIHLLEAGAPTTRTYGV